MSLNGLDDVKVKEAYETAAAEAGGWFLLKYASRDEVELLGKGNGGIVEVRNAIAAHEEPTPLFGFLRYRRRNVIIKYVPEDCSRLVQARVAVHFNAVTERFTPHDTVFPIASSKDLKDSTLSAACSLHTASGSTSSSTSSLRRRRLMEIAEDEEEEHRAKRQSTVPEERPLTARTHDISPISSSEPAALVPPSLTENEPQPTTHTDYRAIIADLETTPPPPREPLNLEALRPKTPNSSTDDGRRKSLQSSRPDLFSYSSYGSNGKPKIKLGPRPSLDVAGRPHTSASQFRPVSSLPAGLKLHKSPSKQKGRSRPQPLQEPSSMTLAPPIPETHVFAPQLRPYPSTVRPSTSSGVSVRPLPSPSSIAPSMKFPTMTPEKARLMKALELRKKKEQAASSAGGSIVIVEKDEQQHKPLQVLEESTPSLETSEQLQPLLEGSPHAEAGFALGDRSPFKTDESDATRSDSYPVSPVEPSEKAESTRASSISGSTDETIQERKTETAADELVDKAHSTSSQPDGEETDHGVRDERISTSGDEVPLLLPTVYSPSTSQPEVQGKKDSNLGAASEDIDSATQEPKYVLAVAQDEEPLSVNDQLSIQSTEGNITAETDDEAEKAAGNVVESGEPAKEWKIPRSKFSQHNLQAERVAAEQTDEPLLISKDGMEMQSAPKSPLQSTFSTMGNGSPQKKRRRALVAPIRTDIESTDRSTVNSDANLSSDDEFMDELQSAVVQEALPISVSKSPISPDLPRPNPKKSNRFSRTFSNPLGRDKSDQKLDVPRQTEKRTVSAGAAFLNKINQQQEKPVAKKVNVGSGISQRIKALEKLSSSASSPPPGPVASPGGTSPSFFSVRKASIRDPSSSSVVSVAERANSLSRNTPSPSNSRDGSPDISRIRDRSSSVKSRLDVFKTSPAPTVKTQKPTVESISVTARIVKDPSRPFPVKEPAKDAGEFNPPDLKKSPLVITHQMAVPEPQPAQQEITHDRRTSKESSRSNQTAATRERRSSMTVIKDFISEGRTSFSERRRSMNLESVIPKVSSSKSPTRPPSTHHTRPISISSRLSIGSREHISPLATPTFTPSSSFHSEDKPEKKSSRASRLINRMSSSFSSSRKNQHPSTVREEFEPTTLNDTQSPGSTVPSTPTLTHFGEVNVQFPDSLLWKRRSMALDSQGFLILTAAGTGKDKQGGGASKKYHFSDLRAPMVPDAEMQELPNSVVLDFVEGSGLQVACEDRAGQTRVLKVLQDAHKSWGAYGQ